MAAISSLKTALHGLKRNPVLFLGGLAVGLVTLPQLATQLAQVPILPQGMQLVTFFVMPFVAAGLYGMADEALADGTGRTEFSTLTGVGREKYVPLLLAKIVELGIVIPFIIIFIFIAAAGVFTLGFGAVATGSDLALGGGVLAIFLGVAVVTLLFILVMFFIQFFPVAIVVNDAGAIASFKQSYRLVRSNIVPTLGYSVIRLVTSLLVSLPVSGYILFRSFQNIQRLQETGGTPGAMQAGASFSIPEIATISVISVATQMLLTTFLFTYAVAFFEAHHSGTTGPDIDGDSVIPEFQ
ncbi:hypothetical protein ACH9L7_07315 [Haloferax sp. S1W]|uniref:DUF7847 domain-containing protein n=1 Tax=Haloferax sp. S1W TaxID=3377110 RepID=UPI0037CB1370